VIDSPYARQRPTATCGSPGNADASSCERRDLPMPGGPTIVASVQIRSLAAWANAFCNAVSSRSRPTNVVAALVATSVRRPSRRQARTASFLPRSFRAGVSSASTVPATSSYVSAPIRISPSSAACSRRAATLTASPVASFWLVFPSAAITSPVLTPVRDAICTPCSRCSSRLSSASVSRISTPARTARRASSSWRVGSPNTAMIASPMNFATVPP
jgi:hypothetical protein